MIPGSYIHPSIWAWRVGNEIYSSTLMGRDYLRELEELARALDPTRPVGFASFRLLANQQLDATALTDFVLMNEYSRSRHGPQESLAKALDNIYALWPDKAVIISEFGLETGWTSEDFMGNTSGMNKDDYYYIEPGTPPNSEEVYGIRSQLNPDQIEVFRGRPFAAGAIFWAYQDYRSDKGFQMGLYDQARSPT